MDYKEYLELYKKFIKSDSVSERRGIKEKIEETAKELAAKVADMFYKFGLSDEFIDEYGYLASDGEWTLSEFDENTFTMRYTRQWCREECCEARKLISAHDLDPDKLVELEKYLEERRKVRLLTDIRNGMQELKKFLEHMEPAISKLAKILEK